MILLSSNAAVCLPKNLFQVYIIFTDFASMQVEDLPLAKQIDEMGRRIYFCQLCNYSGVHSGTARRHVKNVHFKKSKI